jgi:octaprenyl-diphosphate synthase
VKLLAMALALLVVLATAHLENAHLVVLAMSHMVALTVAPDTRGVPTLSSAPLPTARTWSITISVAYVRSNLFYFDFFAGSNAILLAAGFYDRVHALTFHTATLLHDDVVDASTMRRGRATANETFGNPASVLVGDFLYSRAFQMMVDAGQMRIMEILADATNVIAEGEVMQLINMHDASLDENAYLQVIRSKTAKLFEASSRLAAVLAGSDTAQEEACATYGQALGTAFQIIDDVLDYDGDSQEMGKNLGDDLREGKATLPLIAAMQRGSATQAQMVRQAIENGSTDQLDAIVTVVRETGALDVAREAAAAEAHRAIEAISTLPDSAYRTALLQLAAQLLQRRT